MSRKISRSSKQGILFVVQVSTSKSLKPLLAGRKTSFENRRIPRVFEDRKERFDAPDDEDLRFLEVLKLLSYGAKPNFLNLRSIPRLRRPSSVAMSSIECGSSR